MKIRWLRFAAQCLGLVILLAGLGNARGQQKADTRAGTVVPGSGVVSPPTTGATSRPQAKDTVIVPYDPKKPVKEQKPTQIYVPYARFLELWEAAKAARTGVKPEPGPRAFALTAGRYEARLEGERVTVAATIDFTTYNEPWVKVPMPFAVQLSASALDGQPVALEAGQVLVEKPGRHVLTVQFDLPLAAGAKEFAWTVPRTGATRLTLALPHDRWTADVVEAGVVEQVANGKKTVTAALGPVGEIRVKLSESAAVARVAEPALAQITTALAVSATAERATAKIVFSFPGAKQDHFTVVLAPAGAKLAGLEAAGLKSWNVRDNAGEQTLDITLLEPAREQFQLTVTTERSVAGPLPADRSALWFGAGAKRREVVQELQADAGVELAAAPSAALRQADPRLPMEPGYRAAGAWSGAEALKYRVTARAPQHEAQADYAYQVDRRKIEVVASFLLQAKGGPLYEVTLALPPGFAVDNLASDRLQDWWVDEAARKLRVRFKGETPETTPLAVQLVRLYPAAPQQLDLQPLAIEGFAKVTGEAIVIAHQGVEATLKLNTPAGAEAAQEMDPLKAATDFKILPPFERKRAFTFKNQAFAGQVALAALPAKWQAAWVLHAQAYEAWVALSIKTQITLRQGSTDRVTFSLPQALPEARVTGQEVRETRSRVEGGRRIYEVIFQEYAYERADFAIDLEMPHDGTALLPTLEFPGAGVVNGFVVADNLGEAEMKVDAGGAEAIPLKDLPWAPTVTKGASVYRSGAGAAIRLTIAKLEKTSARSAYCAWAEMTTALRADGTIWHKAVWRLQNRTLQFLPVRLPAAGEPLSARVAGQNVRADRGTVDGKPVLLIPLIKTRPGDVSYDVELVWRQTGEAGKPLPKNGHRKFDDPELVGITVEQTFWNVWLPNDRELVKADGNMQVMLEVGREIEKGRSKLQEMESLNNLISSGQASAETLANAQKNFDALSADLSKQVEDNYSILTSRRSSSTVTSSLKNTGESEDELGKWSTGNTAAKEQLGKLVEFNGRVQQQRQEQIAAADRGVSAQTDKPFSTAGRVTVPSLNGPAWASQPGATRTYDDRWRENPDGKKQSEQTLAEPQQQPGEARNKIYVNDNVVLAQSRVRGGPPSTFKQKAVDTDPDSSNVLTKPAPRQPESKPATAPKLLLGWTSGDDTGEQRSAQFNTARGNKEQIRDQIVQQQAQGQDRNIMEKPRNPERIADIQVPMGLDPQKPGGDGTSPSQEIFVQAFLSARKAEELAQAGDLAGAARAYRAAGESLAQIRQQYPTWQKELVTFREGRVNEALAQLEGKLKGDAKKDAVAAAALPPAPPSPEMAFPSPAGDAFHYAERAGAFAGSGQAIPSKAGKGTITLGPANTAPAENAPVDVTRAANNVNPGDLAAYANAFTPGFNTLKTQNSPGQGRGPAELSAASAAPATAPEPEPPTTGLEQAGRISLSVDFPLEGQVFHFQKVKAHAELELEFRDPNPGHTSRNTFIAVVIALVLVFVQRRTRREADGV